MIAKQRGKGAVPLSSYSWILPTLSLSFSLGSTELQSGILLDSFLPHRKGQQRREEDEGKVLSVRNLALRSPTGVFVRPCVHRAEGQAEKEGGTEAHRGPRKPTRPEKETSERAERIGSERTAEERKRDFNQLIFRSGRRNSVLSLFLHSLIIVNSVVNPERSGDSSIGRRVVDHCLLSAHQWPNRGENLIH